MMRLIPTLYACLLRLYPVAFRERFGEEMQYVFDQAWAVAWQRGTLSGIGFCLRESLGLLVSILRSHLAENRGQVMSRLIFNPRIAIPIFALICAIPAAVLSLQRWGYLFAPPSAVPLIGSLREVDSIHFVQFDADYHARVIPLAQIPQTAVPDYPPTRILPLVQGRLDGAAISTPLDSKLTEQLAAVLREQELTLRTPSWAEYHAQPRYCVGRTETCFTDSALLPPDQPFTFDRGVQFQPDGHILGIWPVFSYENQTVIPTGETEARLVTPASGWFYYNHFLPGGFVIQGRDAAGQPLLFVNVASSSLTGGDHYRYYEYLLAVEANRLQVLTENAYGFDVSGLEGITFPFIALFFLLPVLLVWFFLMFIWRLYRLLADFRASHQRLV